MYAALKSGEARGRAAAARFGRRGASFIPARPLSCWPFIERSAQHRGMVFWAALAGSQPPLAFEVTQRPLSRGSVLVFVSGSQKDLCQQTREPPLHSLFRGISTDAASFYQI